VMTMVPEMKPDSVAVAEGSVNRTEVMVKVPGEAMGSVKFKTTLKVSPSRMLLREVLATAGVPVSWVLCVMTPPRVMVSQRHIRCVQPLRRRLDDRLPRKRRAGHASTGDSCRLFRRREYATVGDTVGTPTYIIGKYASERALEERESLWRRSMEIRPLWLTALPYPASVSPDIP
jgi:hypothetical protein